MPRSEELIKQSMLQGLLSFSAFSALKENTISKKVNHLYLVGADAAACVYSTALGAMSRNYLVHIVQDAVITVNDKTMNQMIRQYKKKKIDIIPLSQL